MTTAAELMHSSNNATDADERAQEMAVNIDQDWENEATLYTFDDDSVLVVNGPQLNAYDDIDAARERL